MIWLETPPKPEWVYAGWMPLALTVVVGIIMVALYFNMRKHVRRSDDRFEQEASEEAARHEDATAASERSAD